MTSEPDRQRVDFVVGSDVEPEPASPQHHRRDWTSLRLRLTLAGAAAVLAIGTLVARASAGHHALEQATHTPSATAAPGSSSAATTANALPIAVNLGLGLCPPGYACANLPTSAKARSDIAAAVRHAFGSVRNLRVRNVFITIDHARTPTLFAREILATVPQGVLDVKAAQINANNSLPGRTFHGRTPISIEAELDGYIFQADMFVALATNPPPVTDKLAALLYDPRLLRSRHR